MKFNKINFQPYQVLKAKDLNDLQDALEKAIPENMGTGAFQINIILEEINDNSELFFYGIPDKPYSEINQAIENEQATQCVLALDLGEGIKIRFVGQLVFHVPNMATIFSINKLAFLYLFENTNMPLSDLCIIIGQEDGEYAAMGAFIPPSELIFDYSNGTRIEYNPNTFAQSQYIDIPSIDTSLTKTGYAADAKIVGDKIKAILGNVTADELNTLKELSDALNDDENFAATVTAQLAEKATKAELNEVISNLDIKPDIQVYQITSESTIVNELVKLLPPGVTIYSGDVMIVTNSLGVKSAYQYDEDDGWIACDGNVDASKVIMPFDITLAGSYTQVGNLTKTSTGIATFSTKGKSVAAALQEMLSKREQPKITSQPAVSFNSVTSGAYEVGTTVTPSWNVSLSAGSYTYGPATGIAATQWTIRATNGESATSASGSFSPTVITDDMNYSITASAIHGAGAIAKDNLGSNSSPTIRIEGGTKSASSDPITSYRSWFMYVGTDNTSIVSSSFIRSKASNMGDGNAATTQSNVIIPAGTKRIVIALPQKYNKTLTSVIDVDGMGLDVIKNFTKSVKTIEGYNGYQFISYDVWVAENVNGLAATKYNFIIS